MIYDIVIIGSGISGLNLCDKLNKKEKILLLEKDNNIGGRIQTIKKNGLMYEAGAARFNNYHNKLINLIKRLKLENKFIKIDNKTEYKSYPKNLNNNLKKEFNNIDKIIELLIKKTKDLSKEELQKHTIKSLLKKYLEKEYKGITDYFENIFNYYSEYALMNAYNSLELFEKEFNTNIDYYLLNGGLSQITKKLFNKNKSKIEFKLNYFVNNIELTKESLYLINNEIRCKKIILAINHHGLKQISFNNFDKKKLNKFNKNFNSIVCKPLYRLYFKYKKNDIWFSNINKTTTNLDIKFIIPYDIKNGLIMISYTDGKYANRMLKKRTDMSEDKFINYIHNQILKLYPEVELKKPEKIYDHYWHCAAGYWKINKDSDKIYKELINPFENIYVCNENFSKKQAWIEGALEMSDDVLDAVNNIKTGGSNNKKKHRLEEIEKHNKIDDLWGYYGNDVYNLTNFVKNHPGGNSILKLKDYKHNIKETWKNIAKWHIDKNYQDKLKNREDIELLGKLEK